VINIGSNIEVTILELAQTIIKATDSKSKVIHLDPLEEGDMKRRMPDNSKMLKILGHDLMALETGIKHVLHSDQFAAH
jgi:UDP-glucuronate decarboxylase